VSKITADDSATKINEAQDLSRIKVGLQDKIYQGSQPILTGVDAASLYCYVLAGVEHRDQEIWSWHLLNPREQGFKLDFIVADGAKGLRAAQKAVMPESPCHRDVLHVQQRQDLMMRDAASRGCRITHESVRISFAMSFPESCIC
jgi:hypothetical protein